MTALCGGGPSTAQAGFNNTVVLTAAAVEGALTLFGLEPVAAILAPFLASEVYDLTNFCTVDPPTDPGLTSGDVIDVLNFADPTVQLPALSKVRQWFNSRYWYQVCKCTTGSTPDAPALSNPGAVTTNGAVPQEHNNPCFSGQFAYTTQASASNQQQDLTGPLLPVNGTSVNVTGVVVGSAAGLTGQAWPIPDSVTEVDIFSQVLDIDKTLSGSTQLAATLFFTDNTPTILKQQGITAANVNNPPNTRQFIRSITALWPAGATRYGILGMAPGTSVHANGQQSLGFASTVFCNGPALGALCCPPDPQLSQQLTQIRGLLQAVYEKLSGGLSSYVNGTVHSGLTDHGTVTVDPLAIAIKVNITTLPSYIGEALGSPPFLFDAGFITPANTVGPLAAARLEYSTQFFQLPTLPVAVDFTLAPGVVIEITELKAGP